MRNIFKQMRVQQYIKNILVFLPLVFSLNLFNTSSFIRAALIFLAFCAGSSAVYIINDIADAPRDRLHPRKKNRPIASGAMSVRFGVVLAAFCFVFAGFTAFFTHVHAGVLLVAYIAVNMLYSFVLKRLALVDVFCVMTGFLLRIAAGAASIGVPVSSWLMLTIMSLSLFMGFGKRRGELNGVPGAAAATRRVLSKYSAAFLDKAMYFTMTLSAAFYALWAIDGETAAKLGTENLIWTTPLVIAGLLRYAQILESADSDGDPTTVLLTDLPLLCIVPVYALVVVGIVYFG